MNKPKNADKNPARDEFGTPDNGTDTIVPFLLDDVPVWECAAGSGRMVARLESYYPRFTAWGTTLGGGLFEDVDFLNDKYMIPPRFQIVTNPPFSKKKEFYLRCRDYGAPFALLLPFDMCQWIHKAIFKDGCQGVVPDKRINYITPTGKSGKDSSAQFHSFWLTWGLGLEERFIGVEI